MSINVDCVVHDQNLVGESAVWCDQTNQLWWVDIAGRKIQRFDPVTSYIDSRPMADFPTSIGLCANGGFVLGLRHDVVLWNGQDGFQWLATPEPALPDNRLNEGGVGPDGCFWVGTMQDNLADDGSLVPMSSNTGSIYRVSATGEVKRQTGDVDGITNTFAWLGGTSSSRLITADTLVNTLYEYRYEHDQGLVGERQLFAGPFDRGLPDGSCVDESGYIWNCRVAGGGCLVRYHPDGSIDRVIELPCSWPTSCTFGGRDLKTLYVTSARIGLDAAAVKANPLEGGLFALQPGPSGRPANRFG